ncbi:MAG: Mov34-domain-containing protein [Olpidium bornovanus]|uniref:Mov34-domain-containing protein n=1 Tax=Olpidium bornovanus TaxID=278681 RepID=A0A8H7ZX06_9FUNG|nr:MAG: Mov34-domain-containing protein [Olpidium bornovanus]
MIDGSAPAATHCLNLASSALAGPPPSTGTFSVKVHPVVLFSVLDHFLRRDDAQDRVIGTLLGSRSEDSSEVEIKSCFPVPHTESDNQVAVDMEYHRNMYDLHHRVNHNEVIVGWYATGNDLNKHSPLIQDFYSREAGLFQAIHLTVDTALTDGHLNVRAFVSSPVGVVHRAENCLFLPIPCEVKYHDAERSALEYISAAKDERSRAVNLASDMENLERSIVRLQEMLERVIAYVDGVLVRPSADLQLSKRRPPFCPPLSVNSEVFFFYRA